MKISSLGYCFHQGIKNIGRNRMFSIASVATMSLCIFLLGLFYSITANVNYMVEQISGSLCVKVFFVNDTSDERIKSIGESIKEIDGVRLIHYTSAEEAWESYKDLYFGDEYEELAEGYANDNPLKNSASYEVYFNEADQQEQLIEQIKKIDGVRKVDGSDVTANGLTEISGLVGVISIAVLAVLLSIALFLISNTVSIGIAVRKQEIHIMKLLGAKNSFIRSPFVVEGVSLGLLGSLIPLVALYFIYGNVVNYILGRYSFLSTILSFMPTWEMFAKIIPLSIAIGLGLGLLGSVLSLGRHLKK